MKGIWVTLESWDVLVKDRNKLRVYNRKNETAQLLMPDVSSLCDVLRKGQE